MTDKRTPTKPKPGSNTSAPKAGPKPRQPRARAKQPTPKAGPKPTGPR